MKSSLISRFVFLPVVLCTMSAAPLVVRAQDNGVNGPPKVLVVQTEYTRPGRSGAMHEKTEGAFLQALKANHVDLNYLAMTSLSGPDRALFFSGFSSFADWETAMKGMYKNPAAVAAMDRANVADGDLLAESTSGVYVRRDDLSLSNGGPKGLTGDRYMQISRYFIRPGHDKEWEDVVKLVKAAYQKSVPQASWTMFEERYGTHGGSYLVVTPLKSLSTVDDMLGSYKALDAAMGEDGMKKRDELDASCVESRQMNLFAFSPKMSNPPEAWVKAEPDYWTPKRMEPAKKAEKKDTMKPM